MYLSLLMIISALGSGGFVVGNDAFKLSSADRGDITINNESGHLIVNTAILSGDIVTLRGGEIRLVL